MTLLEKPYRATRALLRPYYRRLRAWMHQRSLNGPRLMREFADAHPQAFFIQVGSNDGQQQDPLKRAIHTHPWRGIMIEPVPYVFERLKKNYQQFEGRVALVNLAIADRDGSLPFYHLARVENYEKEKLPQWYDALGSFNKDVILKHVSYIPDIAKRLVSTEVQCIRFETLCQRHGVTHLDLLHIDTEGYDYEVLKRIDFKRWLPRLVVFEHVHLSPADFQAAKEMLSAFGYEFIQEHLDTWCLNVRDMPGKLNKLHQLWRQLHVKQGI